jgi:hypothetical protein
MSRNCFTLSFVFALATTLGWAQSTNARLEGTVQDQSGAVVPNAKLFVVNVNTQARTEAAADASGNYVFPTLKPGIYTLKAEATGFRQSIVNNIELTIGGTVAQSIKLEVGQTTESVMVEATAISVQTTESQVSSAVLLRDIETLPQLNRTPLTLAIFQPGVQIDIRAGQDATFSHVNGLRQGSNNSKLDGVDINDSVVPRLGLSMTANNSDSVAEFRVVTEGGKAEYGRSAGGQIEMVTRSGTNQYHGSAFDYLRNTDLNANDFFNNQSGGTVPKYIRNIYGGSFGGPVLHDKFFIFGNFQGTRTRQETIRNRTVPTATAKAGIFSYRQGGAVQQFNFAKADPRGIGVDPAVAKLFAGYPEPNNFDVGDGLNSAGYRFNNSTPSIEDQFTIKGDYHLSQNHNVFMRWSWQRNSSVDALNTADATFPGQVQGAQGGHRWGYAIGSNWSLSPTIVNEFIFGHQSATADFLRPNRLNGPTYITNLFTDINFTGFGQGRNSPVNDFTDTITKVRGSHTFKAGANVRRTLQYAYNYAGVYPNLTTAVANGNNPPASLIPAGLSAADNNTFQSLYNDLLGRIDQVTATFYSNLKTFQGIGTPRVRNFILNESGFFVQDDWKVNRKLSLNLGLRWEYFGVPSERDGLQGSLDKAALLNTSAQITDITVQPGGSWYKKDWNNFAPRFGFAYDLMGDGKTAIRGNYGIFYDRAVGSVISTADGNTPGFSQAVPVFPNQGGTDIRLSDPYPLPQQPAAPVLTLAPIRSTSTVFFNPNLRTGYVHSYALNIQRELFRSTILQVGYIGNRGVKLYYNEDINQPRIYGDFLNSFKELAAFSTNGTAPSANNTLVKIFGGTPAAAVTALGASNLQRGLVGTVANSLDRNLYTRYAAAGVPATYLRNFPQFNQVVMGTNDGRSYYDSLQVSVRRTAGDLQFSANYTWSKSMDNISAEGNGFAATSAPIDTYNLRLNRALSDFDRPHSFNLSPIYNIPFGRGKRFGGDIPRLVDTAIGGWQIGSLWIWQAGQPFSVSSQRATTAVTAVGNSYAVYTGTDRNIGSVQKLGSGVFFFTPEQVAQFTFPNAGEIGNSGRNVFRNPVFFEVDASLVKKFAITERHSIAFRAEAYNLLNHPNFGLATANLNINNPLTFGKFSQTLGTQVGGSSARTMQVALRYDF